MQTFTELCAMVREPTVRSLVKEKDGLAREAAHGLTKGLAHGFYPCAVPQLKGIAKPTALKPKTGLAVIR